MIRKGLLGSNLGNKPSLYGGQAVIEGVMIRGQRFYSLAVRRMDGSVYRSAEPLSQIYTGRLRQIPFIRGMIVLIETLVLGIKVLTRSADIALEDRSGGQEQGMSGWGVFFSLAISLSIGVSLFFLLPLFAARSLDSLLDSWLTVGHWADFTSNFLEGVLRLTLLVGYISVISLLKDIKRVFAYHGAEHMTIHAYENGLPLVVDNVRPFSTAHPRCGTAFLLTVAVVAIFVFALLGRPDIWVAITSRILLIPVIASISYEIIRFSGVHQKSLFSRIVATPGMMLQRLTTRRPDDQQIEVAIHAMNTALAADSGEDFRIEHDESH